MEKKILVCMGEEVYLLIQSGRVEQFNKYADIIDVIETDKEFIDYNNMTMQLQHVWETIMGMNIFFRDQWNFLCMKMIWW
jgi:hypothetical protein